MVAWFRLCLLAATLIAAGIPLKAWCASREALVVESCEATFDGKKVIDVPAGITVFILGEQKETGLILARIPQDSEGDIRGLIPATSVVPLGGKEPRQESPNKPAPTAPVFNPDQEMSARDLARFFKTNREAFKQWEGQTVKVSGVVDDLRVVGTTGSMLTAEITLRTRPDLPKVRLMVHASEFLNSGKSDRQELRVQDETLEGRSRDRNYPYRYWYYANGYWRSRSGAKTEWLPIISVGHPLKASGVLTKYHIHLELDGATINKS